MTGLVVHQCPKCVLRFSFRTELEHHLREDHPVRAPAEQTAAMQVAETTVPAAPPKAPPVTPTLATQGGVPRARARTAAWLLFIVGVLLAVYAAVFVSLSTAVVVAALLLSSSWIYVRRARGRARPPRR